MINIHGLLMFLMKMYDGKSGCVNCGFLNYFRYVVIPGGLVAFVLMEGILKETI